jgi:hypothetical protein
MVPLTPLVEEWLRGGGVDRDQLLGEFWEAFANWRRARGIGGAP